MRREQLEHLLRAASKIAGVTDLVVIGSQAILGTYPEWDLPSAATMSVEADLAIDADLARLELGVDESELADLIDGAIGEGSMPSCSRRATMNESMAFAGAFAERTTGRAGRFTGTKDQWSSYFAPCSIHRRTRASWRSVSWRKR